ncbi:hypothetical protein Glove_139g249 [Diversispora epigaea]|uniref:Uncharacterized protein n=1 Tax=Diversispora epigaea TaxID=1348612 RepID=A0A397IVB5_9GLOM|nr:hypothetical protein Glove_139g249 [Diversispora epigaea]
MYGDDENDLDSSDKVNNQYIDDENELESGDKVNNQSGDDESDLESCDKVKNKNDLESDNRLNNQYHRSEIYISLESIGGVIRILDRDDYDDSDGDESNSDDSDHPLKLNKTFTQFELPQQLSIRLSRDHWQNLLELLHTSIIKNQIVEMYSLITGDLEMLFKRHESSVAFSIIHGSPIFAISQNEKILAFCRRTTSITLYFVKNDSKLLIVLEEKEYQQVEILKRQIFVVWDLFATFKDSIRQIDYSEPLKSLKMDVTYSLMNSHGKMFTVRDGGDIFSVLDHPDVALIRNPSAKSMTKIDIIMSDAVYLDSTESTQLIILDNTIQVWKYRNNKTIEKRDKHDRVLEYIWAQKKVIDVQELKIGERKFVLKGSVPSNKCSTPPKSIGQIILTSIRYPIMEYLIKSSQENEDNNRSTTEISKSDLHHAILCIQKRGDSTVILKYLILIIVGCCELVQY